MKESQDDSQPPCKPTWAVLTVANLKRVLYRSHLIIVNSLMSRPIKSIHTERPHVDENRFSQLYMRTEDLGEHDHSENRETSHEVAKIVIVYN